MTTKDNSISKDTLTQLVSHFMLRLGVPTYLNGYRYLRDALEMSIQNMGLVGNITKFIYPDIAKKYRTTSTKVERSIRHAIEVSWENGDIEAFDELFGYNITDNYKRPSNTMYVAIIANYIRLRYWKR